MIGTLVILRVIHIGCAVFWAGTIFFMATFLEPTVRELGPVGAPVMQGLERRGFFRIMPIVAFFALLSGASLFWLVSNHLSPVWLGSRQGIAFSTGGLSAILAFLVGVLVMRPTTLKVGAIVASAANIPEGPARAAHLAPVPALRKRVTLSVRATAALLGVAALMMAVARYIA